MCQNTDCNDYSLVAANTGIATINAANPNLDGTGSITSIITGASNGTIVKSVTIKALQQVRTGMIRLFIGPDTSHATLYKEIPVPTTPELEQTPTPGPILQTFEIKLDGGLKLKPDHHLYASTQNAYAFCIIAEGLDWEYPDPVPDVCCNFKQESAVVGNVNFSTPNTNLDGSGSIASAFTSPGSSNGSLITGITIKALQSTNEGMVRIFLSADGGSTYKLMREILIPETIQSGFEPSFKYVIDEPFYLQPTYSIGVSTQLAQAFGVVVEATSWTYP